ncbi:Vacuolar protein sorting-associated protein 20 [Aspergillus hancockii]|nr:Vacuolar protein sorting-associated protein 20 [Aspergillus hancockii]
MGNTSSSNKISAQDRAILDLKTQRDKLRQYRKRLSALTDRETEIAKECLVQDDRKRALLALRRKKYQESLLIKSEKELDQLEQLINQVQFSLVQKDVLFGLQQGTQVLQALNKEMGGIEGVEKLMGETEEARAYQEEISQMLAGNLSNQDEDEVENELAALQQEAQGLRRLPNAPKSTLPDTLHTKGQKTEYQDSERRAKARAKAHAVLT